MKISIFLWTSILVFCFCSAQNLVPNPSFEEHNSCPDFSEQVHYALGWRGFSSEYYNSCATSTAGYSVPANGFGYQNAASGNAYCGLITSLAGNNYREFIYTRLSFPLQVGKRYYVSIKVSVADSSFCTSSGLGVLFSTMAFSDSNFAPIHNYAHAYTPLIIEDRQNWVAITGYFIADSAYQYVNIGNFFDTINSVSTCTTGFSYYYVDQVCLSTDSLECDFNVNIGERQVDHVTIYPNPTSEFLNISLPLVNAVMSIYDISGKLVYDSPERGKNVMIDISEFSNGMYFLEVQIQDAFTIVKFLIHK